MPGFIQHTILKTSAGKIIEKTTFRRSLIVNFLHTDPVFPALTPFSLQLGKVLKPLAAEDDLLEEMLDDARD